MNADRPSDAATGFGALRMLRALGACVGAIVCLVLLGSLWSLANVPTFFLIALLALIALTVVRPHAGLLMVAIAVPLVSWLCRGWTYSVAWAETVVVAFAAGWFLHDVRAARQADDLDPPIHLVWTIVAASLLVYLTAVAWKLTGNPLSLGLGQMIHRFFGIKASGDGLDAAARLLECLVLFRAASAAAAANSEFTPALMRCIVLAATAAGFLNIQRLWEAAQRLSSPLATFFRYLATIRENVVFPDLNAAGSYFVLALFAAIALGSQRRRWLIGVFIIAVALWVTGSRAALAAALVAGAIPLSRTIRLMDRRRTGIGLAAIGLLLVSTAGVAAYLLPQRGNQPTSFVALRVRWELAKDSVRMTASHPVFGVGVGQYYHLSGEFSSAELLRLFPPARNENAHNNFLQLLAELGLAGFAAFGWLFARAGARIVGVLRERRMDPVAWNLAGGLVAFMLTWFGGHPLLIDEPAFTFWLLLGAAAGWAGRGAPPSPLVRRFAVGACLLVLLLVPIRAERQMAEMDMEHVGFGLSAWQTDGEGVRFRLSTGRSSVFVPVDARTATIPLRSVVANQILHVQLHLDGRNADTVIVPSDHWTEVRFSLPEGQRPPRFRRLDLEVTDPHADGIDILMIGRVEPR